MVVQCHKGFDEEKSWRQSLTELSKDQAWQELSRNSQFEMFKMFNHSILWYKKEY
jgi:hypothetical protein